MTEAAVELVPKTEVPSAYRQALNTCRVPLDEVRRLMVLRPGRLVGDLALTGLTLIAVPLLFAAMPGPVTFAVCFLLSIRGFNSLAQLVHSSDHGGLARNPRTNMRLGNVCAYLLGYTRTGHHLAHLHHHLYLNTVNDPDRIWGAPDETVRQLFAAWMRDLTFRSALERLLQYSQSDRKTFTATPWRRLSAVFFVRAVIQMAPVCVTQLLVFGAYTLIAGPLAYVLLYMLPIMTLYPAQIRLRAAAEHSFEVGYRPQAPQDLWVTRSTLGVWLERFIVAPFGIQYHFEHHLFPAVPHYNLRRLHRLLERHRFPIPTTPGYIAFVAGKLRATRAFGQARVSV